VPVRLCRSAAGVLKHGVMGGRFLVVDDDEGIRRLVSAVLRRQQHEIEVASDGHEAIAKLRHGAYDAMFLDLMMPVCNGEEVLAFVREEKPDVKRIVVMTAAGVRRTAELDRNIVHRVLHKPFNVDDVIDAAAESVRTGEV
jgi:CheY-like chemotaxis protein